jgi:hypothetical protein
VLGRKANLFQGFIHPSPDFSWGDGQVFRAEGGIFFHHAGDDLIFWVLENHTGGGADQRPVVSFTGIHTIHPDRTGGWQ